jgi:DNA-binding NarL/FixJ family response regulator
LILRQVSEGIRFQCLEDIRQFQRYLEKIQIERMTFQRVNSVVNYRHSTRRVRINQLGKLGLTQQQIANETGYSLSTVKREIYAIRENLEYE